MARTGNPDRGTATSFRASSDEERRVEQAPLPQHRHHALAELIGLLDVGIAGQDELGYAQLVVLRDAIGNLRVAADERRSGSAPEPADAGPQVRVDLEVFSPATVESDHTLLANRARRAELALCDRDGLVVRVGDERLRGGPGLVGVVPGDDVQTDPEPRFAALLLGQLAHPLEVGFDLRG